jgi:hypothetical protein
MEIMIYWIVKFFVGLGLIFCLYSCVQPKLMLNVLLWSMRRKLKLFAMEGEIRPASNALAVTRIWSIIFALIFAGLTYVFCSVVSIAYQM